MFEDFRPTLITRRSTEEEIAHLLRGRDLHEGIKKCNAANRRIEEFREELYAGLEFFCQQQLWGHILSFVYKYGIPCPYSRDFLMGQVWAVNDHYCFLKDVHRYHVFEPFETEIEFSIKALRDLSDPASADAYARKTARIRLEDPKACLLTARNRVSQQPVGQDPDPLVREVLRVRYAREFENDIEQGLAKMRQRGKSWAISADIFMSKLRPVLDGWG